jgi:hypothetical protein
VNYYQPASNGGASIYKYTAVVTPGNITTSVYTAVSGTMNIYGIPGSQPYTVSVYASNVVGDGTATVISNLVSLTTSMEFLAVAGGGAGGSGLINYSIGSGGGAGGLLTGTIAVSSGITYTVNVGAGGAPVISTVGSNGGDTTISGSGLSTITVKGGGRGDANGGGAGVTPGCGGSGGGGYATGGKGVYPGSTYLSQARQGYDGAGSGSPVYPYPTGGGGGAGQAGASGTGSTGGKGGDGIQSSISGTSTYYAGGGGGSIVVSGTPGAGGLGGGGAGAIAPTQGGSAPANTGGGGGASGATASSNSLGGSGGSGIVVFRYLNIFPALSATTGTVTVLNTGGYRIYMFTGSGSVTI